MKRLFALLAIVGMSMYVVGCGQQGDDTGPIDDGGPALGNGTTAPEGSGGAAVPPGGPAEQPGGAAEPAGGPGQQPEGAAGAPEGAAPEGGPAGAAPEGGAQDQPESADQPEKAEAPSETPGDQ